MAVRINIEIGHEASLRTKRTVEGYTHDWKVYVRGCDGADIHYYVEKVVFYLHETFQKPKRVVKEPPYAVKESGYAGFPLPIDIYLRNSGEPKKIKFEYNLELQPSGPPISRVIKEKHVFISPPDDFRQKLIRGGGIVTNSSSQDTNDSNKSVLYEEKNQLYNKPKFSGSDPPSKKPKTEPQIPNSFQDLFGPPITKTTKNTVPKPPAPKENKNATKSEKEKSVEKVKNKHSPIKEKEKDREKSDKKAKEEKKKDKEKKDRERERSKEKSLKKEKSPKTSPPSHNSPRPVTFDQTVKHQDKEFKGDKDKKDKEEKKAKKEKRDKDHNRDKEKHREGKNEHKDRKSKSKEMFPPPKQATFQQQSIPSVSNVQPRLEKKEEEKKVERIEKSEDKKHKHRKKDKNKKERDESEDKSHKAAKKTEKEKGISTVQNSSIERENEKNLFGLSPKTKPIAPSPKDKAKPLNKLFNTFVEDASDSSISSREHSPQPPPVDTKKKEKKTKEDKQNVEKDPERRKRKRTSPEQDQQQEKTTNDENTNNNSDADSKIGVVKPEQLDNNTGGGDDYINVLRGLQHKIMSLKDHADLQKVVSLIAETGQYEISAQTFDFDLLLLDRSVVKQLQDFLSTTS